MLLQLTTVKKIGVDLLDVLLINSSHAASDALSSDMTQARLNGNSFSFHVHSGCLLRLFTYLSKCRFSWASKVQHKQLEVTLDGNCVPAPVIFSANDFTVGMNIKND